MQERKPIMIVGAGPVGLALSVALATSGIRSLIFEARRVPTDRDQSRAITWMPKGLMFLEELGLLDSFMAIGLRRTAHEFRSRDKMLFRLSFNDLKGPFQFSLQLPQHDTERLLEDAALTSGLVDIQRGKTVKNVRSEAGQAIAEVESDGATITQDSPWGIACDGAKSTVRDSLGVKQTWRDYGCDSAVADIEGDASRDIMVSDIALDPARPFGWFYFAPGRWRFIYRLNVGEHREQMTSDLRVRALIDELSPEVRVNRVLWSSAFRLGQGQNEAYRSGRWLFAGDAAHAMGPSAGAGMMVGMLGVWRLAHRLRRALNEPATADNEFADYECEQREGSRKVQGSNGLIFRNMAISNAFAGAAKLGPSGHWRDSGNSRASYSLGIADGSKHHDAALTDSPRVFATFAQKLRVPRLDRPCQTSESAPVTPTQLSPALISACHF